MHEILHIGSFGTLLEPGEQKRSVEALPLTSVRLSTDSQAPGCCSSLT